MEVRQKQHSLELELANKYLSNTISHDISFSY